MEKHVLQNIISGSVEIKSLRIVLGPMATHVIEGDFPEEVRYFLGRRWIKAVNITEEPVGIVKPKSVQLSKKINRTTPEPLLD